MKSEQNSSSSASAELLKSIEQLKITLGNKRCVEGDPETAVVHYELQTALKKLLLADLEYALDHKAEQDLWNTCFKNQISIMQGNAKDKKLGAKQKEWQATLYVFLDSALGFYTVLLNQLCQTYDIDLPFRRKDAVLFGSCGDENRPPAAPPSRSSCCYVVQDCLVHMGDVARYRGKVKQAESFYRHAVKLVPSSGQPYNQLALLEAHHGDRISPVYYYVRSIAVRTPFPAATTNLSKLYSRLATQGPCLEGRSRLSAAEYTTLFLQLHARLQQGAEPRSLRPLHATLAAGITRLLLADALSPWRLLQMLAISVQSAAAAAGRPDGAAPLEPASLPERQRRALATALEPAAAALEALLRCSYRLPDPDSRRGWHLLPVVRLYVSWLVESPQVRSLEPFATRPQLWAHLCHLVNGMEVTADMVKQATESSQPLPEDLDLAGFLPLAGVQRGLRLSRPAAAGGTQAALRAGRLRAACRRLAQLGLVWPAAAAGPLQTAYRAEPAAVLEQLRAAETAPAAAADIPSRPSPVSSESSLGSCPTPEQVVPPTGDLANPARPLSRPEPKAGILKSEAGVAGRRRQNVALQALMKTGPRGLPPSDDARIKEGRQVTFRTPSPPAAAPATPELPPSAAAAAAVAAELVRPARLPEPRRPPAPPGPAALWPPPRARHPLDDAPPPPPQQRASLPPPLQPPLPLPPQQLQQPPRPQFNPAVPPPGWAPEPAAPVPRPAWGGWPAAVPAPQPRASPLAAMLSQCRGAAPEPSSRRPDELGVYSLFPSAPGPEMAARAPPYSLFPSAGVQQQSLWPSAGPSPLERLIAQQRQLSRQGEP